jgi:DNA-directed RNA polymerase specialized sigma24 family protein
MFAQKYSNLNDYNQLVLQHQEEAYTLAFYTLGDERKACETVQNAISEAFQHPSGNNFHLRLLRRITQLCFQMQVNAIDLSVVPEIVRRLSNLPLQERLALVLIDILGLNYAQAAMVCHQTKSQISRLLAQGRVHLLAHQPV